MPSAKAARTNPKVDARIRGDERWKQELTLLRAYILSTGLDEDLKWGQPCYSREGKNVVLMHGFKEYCAVLFMKGALLRDPKGALIQQTKNVQAGRQLRFTSVADVKKAEKTVKAYVREAILLEKSGAKVPMKRTRDYEMVDALARRLDESARLRAAFDALTPGRQRGYLYYFAQAKQEKTREARVEKCIPRILDGLGIDD